MSAGTTSAVPPAPSISAARASRRSCRRVLAFRSTFVTPSAPATQGRATRKSMPWSVLTGGHCAGGPLRPQPGRASRPAASELTGWGWFYPAGVVAAAEPPVGVVGLLFTDIEGSTALARSLGDRWETVLARHHEILGDAIG